MDRRRVMERPPQGLTGGYHTELPPSLRTHPKGAEGTAESQDGYLSTNIGSQESTSRDTDEVFTRFINGHNRLTRTSSAIYFFPPS